MKNISIVIFSILIIALLPMPYGYYTLLRLVVCAYFCFALYNIYSGDFTLIEIACILFAILYNPFIKVHFTKEIWMFINVATALSIPFIVKKTGSK